ncbi:MAG: thioredoxin [Gammaproteobacteria bacterium]|nr:MAG: thioredoxin [Gammaproteobacteria bacterium]
MKIQKRVINLLIFAFCLWVSLSSAYAANPRDPEEYFFNQSMGDFVEELELAKEENKKAIMLFFEQDECPFCYRMKATILNRPDVQDFFRKHFLLFTVDIEGDIEIVNFKGESMTQKDFAFKENRVRATPVIAFFDLTGKRVVRYIGAPSSTEEFYLLGQYVIEKVYEKMSFTRYKRQAKEQKSGG